MRTFLCLAALAVPLLAGCQEMGVVSEKSYDALHAQNRNAQHELARADASVKPASPKDGNEPVLTLAVVEPRKVVYTGTFTIVVRDVTAAQDSAKALAEEMGGFVQRLSTDQIVLRVPAEKFYPAVAAAAKLGWGTSRDISTEDVGEKYTDLDIRIKNAKALRDRLAALIEKNTNHKEVVEMEQELSRVTTQMEELEAQLARLKSLIAYATITLKFQAQPQSLPPELRVQLPFGWLHTLGLNTLFSFSGRNLY